MVAYSFFAEPPPKDQLEDILFEKGEYYISYSIQADTFLFAFRNKKFYIGAVNQKADATLEQKQYVKILDFIVQRERDENPEVVRNFSSIVHDLLPREVWEIRIAGTQLMADTEWVPRKQGGHDKIDLVSLVVGGTVGAYPIIIRDLVELCKYKITPSYLLKSLRPSRAVLLAVLALQDGVIRGLRLTTIEPSSIMGRYACSDGYGKWIQEYTEKTIRLFWNSLVGHKKNSSVVATSTDLNIKTRNPRGNMPPNFDLYALESAKPFWEIMGFSKNDTEKHKMSKRIFSKSQSSSPSSAGTGSSGDTGASMHA